MTETSRPRDVNEAAVYGEPASGWAGWVVFGGFILVMLGVFQVIQALVALFDDGYYLVAPSGLAVNVDYNTWGWIHLVIGVVAVLTGIGLFAGNVVARVVGVVIAALSAVANLVFLPAYPLWSTIVIALDVIVIYAIVVHGRELRAQYY
jgi:hypothetical protein